MLCQFFNIRRSEAVNVEQHILLLYFIYIFCVRYEYKLRSASARREIMKLKKCSWEKYISDIENDVQNRQDKAHKIVRHLN